MLQRSVRTPTRIFPLSFYSRDNCLLAAGWLQMRIIDQNVYHSIADGESAGVGAGRPRRLRLGPGHRPGHGRSHRPIRRLGQKENHLLVGPYLPC